MNQVSSWKEMTTQRQPEAWTTIKLARNKNNRNKQPSVKNKAMFRKIICIKENMTSRHQQMHTWRKTIKTWKGQVRGGTACNIVCSLMCFPFYRIVHIYLLIGLDLLRRWNQVSRKKTQRPKPPKDPKAKQCNRQKNRIPTPSISLAGFWLGGLNKKEPNDAHVQPASSPGVGSLPRFGLLHSTSACLVQKKLYTPISITWSPVFSMVQLADFDPGLILYCLDLWKHRVKQTWPRLVRSRVSCLSWQKLQRKESRGRVLPSVCELPLLGAPLSVFALEFLSRFDHSWHWLIHLANLSRDVCSRFFLLFDLKGDWGNQVNHTVGQLVRNANFRETASLNLLSFQRQHLEAPFLTTDFHKHDLKFTSDTWWPSDLLVLPALQLSTIVFQCQSWKAGKRLKNELVTLALW